MLPPSKKWRGGIPDELSDYVTIMMMSSSDGGGLCGQDVKMRTDSLKGQKDAARDDHPGKSVQEHRKYWAMQIL